MCRLRRIVLPVKYGGRNTLCVFFFVCSFSFAFGIIAYYEILSREPRWKGGVGWGGGSLLTLHHSLQLFPIKAGVCEIPSRLQLVSICQRSHKRGNFGPGVMKTAMKMMMMMMQDVRFLISSFRIGGFQVFQMAGPRVRVQVTSALEMPACIFSRPL